jgi:hypothetical protein
MSKKSGQQKAIHLAIEKLQQIDLHDRCCLHGFTETVKGKIKVRMFGIDYYLQTDDFQLLRACDNVPAGTNDHILLLHYLISDLPVKITGNFITFRHLPGGQFYWKPFVDRTTLLLARVIGNNTDKLITNLEKFDWEELSDEDFSAQIHAIGNIYLTLKYQKSDDEFPPAATILFDSCIKRIYCAEDVAVLSSRICLNLLN